MERYSKMQLNALLNDAIYDSVCIPHKFDWIIYMELFKRHPVYAYNSRILC